MVVADVSIPCAAAAPPAQPKRSAAPLKIPVCHRAMQNPENIKKSQEKLEQFRSDNEMCDLSVDAHVQQTLEFVSKAAQEAFPLPQSRPRKHWIPEDTWAFLKHVSPARMRTHGALDVLRSTLLPGALHAWRHAPREHTPPPSACTEAETAAHVRAKACARQARMQAA